MNSIDTRVMSAAEVKVSTTSVVSLFGSLAPDSSFMRRAERYIPTYGVSALQTIPIIFAIYILGILS